AWCVVLKIAAVVRLRTLYRERQPYRVRGDFDVAGREWPLLLLILDLVVAPASIFLTATFDPGSVVGVSLVLGLTAAVSAAARRGEHAEAARSSFDELQLLASDEVELRNVEARPGNLLVPVRKPHALTHLNAALSDAGDRDIVVMTARLIGIDVPDETAIDTRLTEDERQLFAAVTTLAERRGRAVRLLIAPGINVFDTVVETAIRLQSSEIHVGESEVLAARDQARLLGESWERAAGQKPADVRLFIHHPSGRTAAYHLGPHAPTLS